jgi:phage shock protein PspC (stress-responsive transcriptional regulator)
LLVVAYAGLAVDYGWVSDLTQGPLVLLMSTKAYFGLLLYGLLAWWLVTLRRTPSSDER